MNVIVAMASDRPGGTQAIYLKQLRAAGVPYVTEFIPGFTWAKRLEWMKNFSRGKKDTCLVFTDAWDVLFFGTKEELHDEAEWMCTQIVFGAERNCFPDPHLALLYPEYPFPWKYLNAGVIMAEAEWLGDFLSQFDLSIIRDDQEFWTHRFLYDNLGDIDYECRLVHNLFQGEKGDLTGNVRPYNTITESFPLFIHANGKASLPACVEMALIP